MRILPVLAATAALLSPSLAISQDAAPDVERYSLQRTDDGYVRMDRETGRMSICAQDRDQLVCRMSVDERDAYEARIEELERRVAALEAGDPDGATGALPSPEEFDRSLSYMRSLLQTFFDTVREFERDLREPAPDRT